MESYTAQIKDKYGNVFIFQCIFTFRIVFMSQISVDDAYARNTVSKLKLHTISPMSVYKLIHTIRLVVAKAVNE